MDRREFLSLTGLSAGGIFMATCIASCKKTATAAPSVDFTLDLSQSANAALNAPGGYVYSNGVIVAKTTSGSIVAVAASCTHQGTNVQYQSSGDRFHCPNHGANFSDSGAVLNGPATQSLKQYTVTITGNMVNVKG